MNGLKGEIKEEEVGGDTLISTRKDPRLGTLSAHFESGGRGPGTINNYNSSNFGDHGGASYGTFQISHGVGTLRSFLSWLEVSYPLVACRFRNLDGATCEFDSVWRETASEIPEEFEQIQHEFIRITHYDALLQQLQTQQQLDLHLPNRASVVRDVVWSTSVQHGPTNGARLIKNAIGDRNVAEMSDYDLIVAIYNERGANDGRKYFSKNSDQVIRSVVNRFKKECGLAVARLTVVY